MTLQEIISRIAPLQVKNIDATKNYIRSWNSLRFFIGDWSVEKVDDIYGINLLEYLVHHISFHNKEMPIEIIVRNDITGSRGVKIYSTFSNVAHLLGIEVTSNIQHISGVSSTGIPFSLMTLAHFHNSSHQAVDAAFITGSERSLLYDFGLRYFFQHEQLAISKRIFYFNPLNWKADWFFSEAETADHIQKGNTRIIFNRAQELPYFLARWNEIPSDTISKEINFYRKINSVAADYLKKIMELKKTDSVYLFPMHGLHPNLNSEETLLNLLLAANNPFTDRKKPLLVLLFDNLLFATRDKLQALIANNISSLEHAYPKEFHFALRQLKNNVRFCDANNTDTCLTNLNSNEIAIVAADNIPNHLFRYFFSQQNDYPSVFADPVRYSMLLTDQKFGLPCKNTKFSIPEWGTLTNLQRKLSNQICMDYRDSLLWENHSDFDTTLKVGITILNRTTPVSISETEDRILFMTEQMRKLDECDDFPNQPQCLLDNPSLSSVSCLAGKIAAKNIGYGLAQSLTFFGARSKYFDMRRKHAEFTSSFLRISLQAYVEEYPTIITALLLFPTLLDLVPNKSAKSAKEVFNTSILFLHLLLLFYTFNKNTFLISLLMLASTVVPDFATRQLMTKMFDKKPSGNAQAANSRPHPDSRINRH